MRESPKESRRWSGFFAVLTAIDVLCVAGNVWIGNYGVAFLCFVVAILAGKQIRVHESV